MESNRRSVLLIGLVAAALAAASLPARAAGPGSSVRQFRFKSSKFETGVLYRYERTTLDAAKEGFLLVYVPSRTKVLVLRGEKGASVADEFAVDVDWGAGGTASRFEWTAVAKGGARRGALTGDLNVESGLLTLTPGDPAAARFPPFSQGTLAVGHVPAHILPLDFVTLGLALRFMADPRKEATIGVVGVGEPGGLPLAWKGKATLRFVELVNRDGVDARKYSLTGEFLSGQEGAIWVNDEKGHIIDLEIPASAGDWKDLKYYLTAVEKADDAAWEKAKAEAIATNLK